jgi:hypothetical protein
MLPDSPAITRLENQVRTLRQLVIVLALTVGLLGAAGFSAQGRQHQRFDELDVERLNVVTKTGKYAVVIANSARMPGNIIGGKEHAHGSSRGGGLLFYNRDGDEAGGLIFDNEKTDSTVSAFGQLSVDRYGSDQVAVLKYYEAHF